MSTIKAFLTSTLFAVPRRAPQPNAPPVVTTGGYLAGSDDMKKADQLPPRVELTSDSLDLPSAPVKKKGGEALAKQEQAIRENLARFARLPAASVFDLQPGSTPSGLTEETARAFLKEYGPTLVAAERPPSFLTLLWGAIANPFNFLLTFLAVVSIATGDKPTFVVMMLMVIAATGLRLWQDVKAVSQAAKLLNSVTTRVRVLRRQSTATSSATSQFALPPSNPLAQHHRDHNGGGSSSSMPKGSGYAPPRFTIDLSLPPSLRYAHLAPHFTAHVPSLSALFDELIKLMAPPSIAAALHLLARLALRRVASAEETAELRGICRATGVKMHLLVAFNVLLDLLLGCTSGGVKVEVDGPTTGSSGSRGGQGRPARMLHFRTLDWGMDPLRRIVVELDFVRRASGPVVATSVTYFGYVGVLTGVRRGLSMSLNFRPHHDASTWPKYIGFRLHQLLVVLGWRRSISSVLRGYLLSPDSSPAGAGGSSLAHGPDSEKTEQPLEQGQGNQTTASTMHTALTTLPSAPSTSAYLIFCTPRTVYSLEKDYRAATVHQSSTFLTTYNHDVADEDNPAHLAAAAHGLAEDATGMEAIVGYSIDRKRRMDGIWRRRVQQQCKRLRRATDAIRYCDVLDLVLDQEISNEETHYAVVMDPEAGKVLWSRVFPAGGHIDDGE